MAELVAARTPFWKICEVIGRDRWTTWRNINYLRRLPPPPPKRSPLRLSLAEREEISRGLAGGESLRAIARRLGRAPSTVSREVAANGGARRYRACVADRRAVRGMRRPKAAKLAQCPRLRAVVEAKLELRWSPQQISGWLALAFPDDPEMWVSHETIYLSLFVQARGALRQELTRYLRTGRMTRRPAGHVPTVGKGQLTHMVHISERPAEADDRAVPGHWEGDLVFGKGMSAVATLVERSSRFVMLVGLPNGHTADVVAAALADKIDRAAGRPSPIAHLGPGQGDGPPRRLHRRQRHARLLLRPPQPLAARHQREHQRAAPPVLPQAQLRPPTLTQPQLDAVADELNGRPRQTLGWQTPSQALDQAFR